MKEGELEKVGLSVLESQGFKVEKTHPKGCDAVVSKKGKSIAVEFKLARYLQNTAKEALGQLSASKILHGTDEEWLIVDKHKLPESIFLKAMAESGIRIFGIEDKKIAEITGFLRRKKDRKKKYGYDIEKIVKMWKAMTEAGDWLHIAEISRRTGINQATVRYYINNYFAPVIEETSIVPSLKLRLVKLKPNVNINNFLQAVDSIKRIKSEIS